MMVQYESLNQPTNDGAYIDFKCIEKKIINTFQLISCINTVYLASWTKYIRYVYNLFRLY